MRSPSDFPDVCDYIGIVQRHGIPDYSRMRSFGKNIFKTFLTPGFTPLISITLGKDRVDVNELFSLLRSE